MRARRGVFRTVVASAMASATFSGATVAGLWLGQAPALASNDERFGGQWGLQQIFAPAAWTRSTGAGVIIGVVDTGVDLGHPDLAGKVVASANCIWRRPCEMGGGQDDDQADLGHGTIVSGIAAAKTGNGLGVAGAAPDAQLVVAKSLDGRGTGSIDDIRAGIDWVVSQGARVVNLSLGDDQNLVANLVGSPLRAAVEAAWSKGVVPVLASGNLRCDGRTTTQNYGSLNALVVGATDRSGGVACYSSPPGNAKWGLVAPGGSGSSVPSENIYSTGLGGQYVAAAGTSMAAPHVSAAIALLLSQGLTPPEAVERLLNTLDRVPCGTGCQGRLNMAAAVGVDPSAAPPRAAPVSPAPTLPAPPRPTTTRPPTTRPSTTSTPSSTTTTEASAPEPEPIEVVAPPARLVAGRPRPVDDGRATRNPVMPAMASIMVAGTGMGVASLVRGRRPTG